MRFGRFSIAQSNVQMPVGPAPMMSTVSSSEMSLMRVAQKPVARTSPTKSACSSETPSGMRFSPCVASGTRTYSVCPDAIVRTTLSSICSSDLHIKHGSVPRAVLGITLGHEMVGIVEEIGPEVKNVKVGDRVIIDQVTACGHCYACRKGRPNVALHSDGGGLDHDRFFVAQEVNQFVITSKELDVRGSRLQNRKFQDVIDLVNEGKVDLRGSISHTWNFEDAQAAFDFVDSRDPSYRKGVLTFKK